MSHYDTLAHEAIAHGVTAAPPAADQDGLAGLLSFLSQHDLFDDFCCRVLRSKALCRSLNLPDVAPITISPRDLRTALESHPRAAALERQLLTLGKATLTETGFKRQQSRMRELLDWSVRLDQQASAPPGHIDAADLV